MPRLLKGWHGDPGRPTTAPTWQQMALPGGGTRDAHLRYDWLTLMASTVRFAGWGEDACTHNVAQRRRMPQ